MALSVHNAHTNIQLWPVNVNLNINNAKALKSSINKAKAQGIIKTYTSVVV